MSPAKSEIDDETPHAPAVLRVAPLVVTGGAGFIGCNLADRLAAEGHHVLVLDSLVRPGVEANLHWLRARHGARVAFVRDDVRDRDAVAHAVSRSAGVFHLAAQVAVTTSLCDPRHDLDVNLIGTLNVLEAARTAPNPIPVVFASTNKVYGNLADLDFVREESGYSPRDAGIARHGVDERRSPSFHTPYGCSKGAADQYVLDYAASFGVPSAVLRMSCVYGPRQRGNEDQGWVAHFARCALTDAPVTVYGDGHQVRDLLYVADAVEAYVRALRRIGKVSGRAFNLGGGPGNAVSLLQVIARLEAIIGRPIDVSFSDWRPGDQRWYVSDTRAVSRALDLSPPRSWEDGLARMLEQPRGDDDAGSSSFSMRERAQEATL